MYTAQYCTGTCPVYVTTDTEKVKQYAIDQYACIKFALNHIAMLYDIIRSYILLIAMHFRIMSLRR